MSGRLNLSKARVLVVDDNPQAMEILSQLLLGIGVRQARKHLDSGEARQSAAGELFDLILVDHDMPGDNGADFCRQVRADPQGLNYTTAVIVLAALPSQETVRTVRDAGANYVVAKPVMPAVLLDRIQWIARENRPFVTSDVYRGPDRRFQNLPLMEGAEERRAEALRLIAEPERALSQSEINSLFD